MADETELEQQEVEQEQEQQEEERTFTQAEVDAMIEKRLARERKAFRQKQKAAATQEEDEAPEDHGSERDSELEIMRRENHLLKQGVPADDVDYYVYKISKLVDEDTSFEEATKKFLKDNKRVNIRMDTGARLNGGAGKNKSANDTMNDLLRKARG